MRRKNSVGEQQKWKNAIAGGFRLAYLLFTKPFYHHPTAVLAVNKLGLPSKVREGKFNDLFVSSHFNFQCLCVSYSSSLREERDLETLCNTTINWNWNLGDRHFGGQFGFAKGMRESYLVRFPCTDSDWVSGKASVEGNVYNRAVLDNSAFFSFTKRAVSVKFSFIYNLQYLHSLWPSSSL